MKTFSAVVLLIVSQNLDSSYGANYEPFLKSKIKQSTPFKDGIRITYELGSEFLSNVKNLNFMRALDKANKEWNETLRVKSKPTEGLVFPRDCEENDKVHTPQGFVCQKGCLQELHCGFFTIRHRTVCRSTSGTTDATGFVPDGRELQIIIEEVDDHNCNSDLIVADYCRTDPVTDRPILGFIAVCKAASSLSVEKIGPIIQRAMGRILGFNHKAFAFLRDERNQPRTQRDPRTNLPAVGTDVYGRFTPDPSILFYKTMDLETPTGFFRKSYRLLALPTLVEYGKEYYAFSELEGIPLEDEGRIDVMEEHFDSRFVAHDIMTSEFDQKVGITGFTLAFMHDSGWYDISDAHEFAGTWGKDQGEEFFTESCSVYTKLQQAREMKPTPYCSFEELTVPACMPYPDSYGYCDIKEDSNSLLIFPMLPKPRNNRLRKSKLFAGSKYRNNCPTISGDLSATAFERISQTCTKEISDSDIDPSTNKAHEQFGSQSRCLDHHPKKPWTLEANGQIREFSIGASCHMHRCSANDGLQFKIGNVWTVCPLDGGYVETKNEATLGILTAHFYCQPCRKLCNEKLCTRLRFYGGTDSITEAVSSTTTAPSATTAITSEEEVIVLPPRTAPESLPNNEIYTPPMKTTDAGSSEQPTTNSVQKVETTEQPKKSERAEKQKELVSLSGKAINTFGKLTKSSSTVSKSTCITGSLLLACVPLMN